jgi:hypothetical protein
MNAVWLGVALALTSISNPVMAQATVAFPSYDVQALCSATSNRVACQQLEMSARARLAAIWPSLPPAKRAQCSAAGAQRSSYVAAESCATS